MAEFIHNAPTSKAQVPSFSPEPMSSAEPDFYTSFSAGFQLESDVKAAYEILTAPTFERDAEFDVLSVTKASSFWDSPYRNNFAEAGSQAEWDYLANKIAKENRLRQASTSGGWGGFFGAMAGGVASPTMLIPALGPYRGIKAVGAAAALGVGAAGIAEIPLQLNQETRTIDESLTAMIAGGVIGGVIGTGANVLKGWQERRLIREFETTFPEYTKTQPEEGMASSINNGYGTREIVTEPLVEGDWQTAIRTDTALFAPPQIRETYGDNVFSTLAARSDLEGFIDTLDPSIRQSRQALADELGALKAVKFGAVSDEVAAQIGNVESRLARASGKKAEKLQAELDELQATKIVDTNPSQQVKALEKELARVDEKLLKRFDEYAQEWRTTPEVKAMLEEEGIDGRKLIRSIRDDIANDPEQGLRRKLYEGESTVRVVQEGPNVVPPSTIPSSGGAGAGAQFAGDADAGGLKNIRAIRFTGAQLLSPIVQTVSQGTHNAARRAMMKLGVAGLRFENNVRGIAANPGGTVEALVKLHNAKVYKATIALDELHAEYLYNAKQGKTGVLKARLASTFRQTGDKLDRPAFNKEVSRALIENDTHPIKEVQAAAQILRAEVFDPMLREAKAVGLFDELDFDEESYFTRIYDTEAIARHPTEFINKLADHYEARLLDEVAKSNDRYASAKKLRDDLLDDLSLDEEAARARREQFKADLENLGETSDELELKALGREARELRKAKKEGNGGSNLEARLEEIKEESKALREATADQRTAKRDIKRRLRDLDRTYWAFEEKRQKQLELLDRVGDQALNSFRRVLARGKKLGKELNTIGERRLRKELKLMGEQDQMLIDRLARAEKRLDRAKTDETAERAKATLVRTREKLEKLEAQRLELSDTLDNRATVAAWLERHALDSTESVNKLTLSRGERIGKIKKKIEDLDPKRVGEVIQSRVEATKTKFARVEDYLDGRMRELGIEDWNHAGGSELIRDVAAERAEQTHNKIMKYNHKVGGIDLATEERGSELARVLSIPSSEIFDFLVTDAERVVRDYVRQVGADVELKRAFGDVDLKGVRDEMNAEHVAIKLKAEEDGATEAQLKSLDKRHSQNMRNIMTAVARLRHTYGIPDNTDGFVARGGKALLDLNNMRFMGSVAVSSISDPKQIVLKNGLARTMRTAMVPFINGMKGMKLSAEEARLMGVGLDPVLHSRATAFADTLDQYVGNTVVERGIHTASSKFGNLALFNYWTRAMKDFNHVVSSAKMSDDLTKVIEGKGTAKQIDRAREDLAYLQIDSGLALRIHEQLKETGTIIDGVHIANIEDWTDEGAAQAYKAAFQQLSTDTIIEPGLELPNFTNASVASRLIWQFKSFGLASHSKTLAASLQTPDAAIANSIISGVGLGMVGYFLHSTLVGGEAKKRMEDASIEKWLDEGISRSGILGAFDMAQRVAERIPATSEYASFSGERTTRRAGTDVLGEILGPSYDFASRALNVLTAIDDPTQSTVRQARALLPYQNIFYLRGLFTLLEDQIKEQLPEKRAN